MKTVFSALRYKIIMTIVLGLAYPFLIAAVAQIVFPNQANGDFKLIGQKFEQIKYFWSRPSAVDYNPLPSGGSNLGPTSLDLKKVFEERLAKLKAANPTHTEMPPQDLLFASASGLDPHISVQAAKYQVERIANARNLAVGDIQNLVNNSLEPAQWGFFGEPVVNVLVLNKELDKMHSIEPVDSRANHSQSK